MQFPKLRYFSNLINLIHLQLLQRQRHFQCYKRYNYYRYYDERQWTLLTFIAPLLILMTATLANQISSKNYAYTQAVPSLENPLNFAAITSLNANQHQNSTDDFERAVFAQLKREQELDAQADERSMDEDYDTASPTAGATQRKMLLSRKRRYLLFPEGSSFQVVYDGIVGVVDYTNYLILGITVALAWELPTKAPSEMLEDIKMQLDDGSLLLRRNDTATNITFVDTKKEAQKIQQTQNSKSNSINLANERSNYGQKVYSNQYPTNKDMLQPSFLPPMHGNYYHQRQSQAPSSRTSTKYAYYFQPKSHHYTDATVGATPYYNGKKYFGDWRRKGNYHNDERISRRPIHPFTRWAPEKLYRPMYSDNDSSPGTGTGTGTNDNNTKYPWWNLASRLTNSLRGEGTPPAAARQFNNNNNNNNLYDDDKRMWRENGKQQQTSSSGYYQSNSPAKATAATSTSTSPSMPRKHRIYPVFGKRSLPDISTKQREQQQWQQERQEKQKQKQKWVPVVKPQNLPQQEEHQNHQNEHRRHQTQHQPCQRCRRSGIESDELSKFDRIHIRHHRRTRHTLYEKIEKYLDKRGAHGHHCVLRALCETGQKANEVEPGSFLGELMRTLFTIPEPNEEELHRLEYKEIRYDAAHAYTGNCVKRYFHCKDSLWESHFVA